MKVTSSRRPSTRRSASLYSRPRQEIPQKIYDETSDVSDLESDESVPSEEDEETNKLEDATYQSEEDEMDEDQDIMEEMEEEEENEQIEEPEEDIEEEMEQIEDDIDIEAEEELIEDGDDATPIDDEEDFEAGEESDEVDEDEDEEDDEGQSDYEEEVMPRKTRGGLQRSQQGQIQQSSSLKGKMKIQPEKQPISRKRGSIAEPSSSSHGHRILTKRQRAKLNENYQQDLLQLPMEPMKKKHMTEEEIALKKSEIARRRKHQSIQRAEQDKMDTINRLLKKQTTKRRTKDQDDTDSVQNDLSSTSSLPLSSFHYVNNIEGSTLSIPDGVEIPIRSEKGPKYPPPIPHCAIPGCNVPKKYCSVKTFEYACSMDHLLKLESKG